MHSQFMWNTN